MALRVNVRGIPMENKPEGYLLAEACLVLEIKGPEIKPMSALLQMPHGQRWWDRHGPVWACEGCKKGDALILVRSKGPGLGWQEVRQL